MGRSCTYLQVATEILSTLRSCSSAGDPRILFVDLTSSREVEDMTFVEKMDSVIEEPYLSNGHVLSFYVGCFTPEDWVRHKRSRRVGRAVRNQTNLRPEGCLQKTPFSRELIDEMVMALKNGKQLRQRLKLHLDSKGGDTKYQSSRTSHTWTLLYDTATNCFKLQFHKIGGSMVAEDVLSQDDFVEFWAQMTDQALCQYCFLRTCENATGIRGIALDGAPNSQLLRAFSQQSLRMARPSS
jgi:hypothetical protein